jgi:hypothetical protein
MRHTVSGGGNALDTRGADRLTDLHIANFLGAVRGENELHSPINEAYKSVALCHLGNIAQWSETAVPVDVATGRPVSSRDAQSWSREYESGWEPSI